VTSASSDPKLAAENKKGFRLVSLDGSPFGSATRGVGPPNQPSLGDDTIPTLASRTKPSLFQEVILVLANAVPTSAGRSNSFKAIELT